MGTSEGPDTPITNPIRHASKSLTQKGKEEEDQVIDIIDLRSSIEYLVNQKVRGARIAKGDVSIAQAHEKLSEDDAETPTAPAPDPIDVKLTQWKSVAIHGTGTGVVGLANILWLTNFGTELPDEVSQVLIAAVAQVAAGQGIPVWLANFVMRWKS